MLGGDLTQTFNRFNILLAAHGNRLRPAPPIFNISRRRAFATMGGAWAMQMLIGLHRRGVVTVLPESAVPRLAQIAFLLHARSQRGIHIQQE